VISGDRALLTLVLQNLVENGPKHVEQRTPHVVVSDRTTDLSLEIAIRDDGIGVREEHCERSFAPVSMG
jgi:signal transduction histidine kinase